LAEAYNNRQSFLIEGPPAVSKTFAIWVFASLVGLPYKRVPFSPGTKRTDVLGGNRPGEQRKLKAGTLQKFFKEKPILFHKQRDTAYAAFVDEVEADFLQKGIRPTVNTIEWIADQAGVREPFKIIKNPWYEPDTIYLIENGGLIALDEPNVVEDTSFFDGIQQLIEPDTWIIDIPNRPKGGGKAKRHENMFVVLAQNPVNVGNRNEHSIPVKSRTEWRTKGPITREYIMSVLEFFTKGVEGDYIRTEANGTKKKYRGRKNVDTKFRPYFEHLPFLDSIIAGLTEFHMTMVGIVDAKQIGSHAREGGNYVFDQRDIAAFLNSMVAVMNGYYAEQMPDGSLRQTSDWVSAIKRVMMRRYINGMQVGEDQEKALAVLNGLPMWNEIERLQKTGSRSGLNARVHSSVQVDEDASEGSWTLRAQSIDEDPISPVRLVLPNFANLDLSGETRTYLHDRAQEGKIVIVSEGSGATSGKVEVEVNDAQVLRFLQNTFAKPVR
jgi:hypothetical protein